LALEAQARCQSVAIQEVSFKAAERIMAGKSTAWPIVPEREKTARGPHLARAELLNAANVQSLKSR
jgi:hypothetical protein